MAWSSPGRYSIAQRYTIYMLQRQQDKMLFLETYHFSQDTPAITKLDTAKLSQAH
jgi:hypothetical protein